MAITAYFFFPLDKIRTHHLSQFPFNLSILLRFSYSCTPNLCHRVQCNRMSIFYSHDTKCHTLDSYMMDTESGSHGTLGPNNHNHYCHRNDIVPSRRKYFEHEMLAHDCSIFGIICDVHESIFLDRSRTETWNLQPIFECVSRPLDSMLLYPFH